MLLAGIHLHFEQLLVAQGVVRQHAFDRALDHQLGFALQHIHKQFFAQAAGIAGEMRVGFPSRFLAGEHDFIGIDNNDKIADVGVRRKLRLVLAAQNVSDLAGEPPQHFVFGVNDVPFSRDLALAGHIRLQL